MFTTVMLVFVAPLDLFLALRSETPASSEYSDIITNRSNEQSSENKTQVDLNPSFPRNQSVQPVLIPRASNTDSLSRPSVFDTAAQGTF